MSLDPRNGNVDLYSRAAALRLEAGFHTRARSVTFKDLGDVLQETMVDFSGARTVGRLMQISLKGVFVVIMHDGTWKFAPLDSITPGDFPSLSVGSSLRPRNGLKPNHVSVVTS